MCVLKIRQDRNARNPFARTKQIKNGRRTLTILIFTDFKGKLIVICMSNSRIVRNLHLQLVVVSSITPVLTVDTYTSLNLSKNLWGARYPQLVTIGGDAAGQR